MIWIIIIVLVIIVAFNVGSKTGEAIGSADSGGGMSNKYATLIDYILSGHTDARIIKETRTYIRAGVYSPVGTVLFHIQQSPNNKVIIQYESKNSISVPDFSLSWTFMDSSDQDYMISVINKDIEKKIMSHPMGLLGYALQNR